MILRLAVRSILVLSLAWAAGVPAGVADLDQQRRDYFAALEALKAGQSKRYRTIMERQKDYVLRGYLDYEYLKDRVSDSSPKVLRRFLEENSDAPIAGMLRRKWLHHLAERGDWKTFLAEYREDLGDDNELNCRRLTHLLETAPYQVPVMDEIDRLWLTGHKLPGACVGVFRAWEKAGHRTPERVWARIRLAMESRNVSFASQLGAYLDPEDRVWLERWIFAHRDPARALARIDYPVETPLARSIVRHGVVRLAYRDPEVAMKQWGRLKEKFAFAEEEDHYVRRWIGVLAAQAHLPRAADWLADVPPEPGDETLRHWRVLAAIQSGQWEAADRFIAGMTEAEKRDSQWRYWQARAWEQTGREKLARAAFAELARERSYYGFLASDRLDRAYSMQHVRLEVAPAEIDALLGNRGIQLAQELFLIGEIVSARRQWAYTMQRLGNRELQAAAVLAARWGWHDRAIATVNKTDHLDDLELRFPVLYQDIVQRSAEANRLDPGWVYGVMRQESAFVPDARSHAGALGLMQLMPSTGRMVARRLNLSVKGEDAIIKIENNLRLGAHYLRTVLDRHQGNHVLATAAYNAGPNRSREWLPRSGEMDADVWIDTIPYSETRGYVKNVLAFTTVYDYRLGNEVGRLRERMPPVSAAN